MEYFNSEIIENPDAGKKQTKRGTLEMLLSSKTKTLKATVKAFLDEIKIRHNLNVTLLNYIDEEICKEHTKIRELENLETPYLMERFLDIRKIKLKIEDRVLEHEREKRKEHLECWRDLMFLKKYLMMALREYWDLVKRKEMLQGDFE